MSVILSTDKNLNAKDGKNVARETRKKRARSFRARTKGERELRVTLYFDFSLSLSFVQ